MEITGAVLEKLVNDGQQEAAIHMLDRVSPKDATRLVCAPFGDHPRSLSIAYRQFAYNMLRNLKSAQTDEGFSVLLSGLDVTDASQQLMALQGLAYAPESKHAILGPRLLAMIQATTDDSIRSGVLQTLAQLSLPSVELRGLAVSLLDNEQVAKRVRIAAATYLCRTLPVTDFLRDCTRSDCEIILAAMVHATGMHVPPRLSAEVPDRQAIRAHLIKCLGSEDVKCRKTALETVALLLPEDFVIIRSRADYEMPADLHAALGRVAKHDPEESLRQRAERLIDPAELDRYVEQRLRSGHASGETKPD